MTLEEFGQVLRGEREKRGITIDQAADALKINARILSALEAGNMAALPPGAYTRGFIRTYGTYLGFDNEDIQNVLQSISGTAVQSKAPAKTAHEDATAEKKRSGMAVWLIVAVGLAAVLAYWAYSKNLLSHFNAGNHEKIDSIEKLPSANSWTPPEPVPVKTPAEEQIITLPAQSLPEKIETNNPEPKLPEASLQADTDLPPAKQDNTANDAQQATTGEANTPVQESQAALKPHKLIITATEECWVHSRADKTDTRQFSLRKGDTFALTFAHDLELKLGNAGGVNLRYDGRDLPPAGTSGQVRTIKFPPEDN